jgi:Zn-dependent protease
MEPIIVIFYFIILIFSVILHELAHGYMAFSLGDPTAKYEGRLTFNPLKHLDPFGSVILPLLLFITHVPILIGWAKPVPINPYNFRDQKWGEIKVSLAGPATNFAIAVIFGLLIRFFYGILPTNLIEFFVIIVNLNLVLAIFNLVPIPPLDGSWILFHFLPDSFFKVKMFLQQYGTVVLVFFLFFGGPTVVGYFVNLFSRIIIGI